MCEAKVFLDAEGGPQLIMEDVVSIKPTAEGLTLVDLFGEEKAVKAALKEVKLLEHVVLLEPL